MTKANRQTFIFISIAFIFSILIRLIWVYQFSDMEQFKFHNQFMINTNDGYFWAEGARDIISGIHQDNDHSPLQTAAAGLTAFLVKILPFSFESIIFYMPVFFSSLVVIPIVLIGKSVNKELVGFIASLLAAIAWSYYNRTMAGYYDTDLLNIVIPTFLLWSLIWAIKTQDDKYLLISAIDIIIYRWWYPQSYALEFSFFSLIFIYFIYEHFKNKNFHISYYILTLLTFMMFAMVQLSGYIRFGLVVSLFIVLKLKKEIFVKYIYYLFGFALVLFLSTGGLDPILGKLKAYVFKEHISTIKGGIELHFFTVMQTVREAGLISFDTFANRISGNLIIFLSSIIGYIWFVLREKVLLLALPMVGLGFLALSGGLRFTIYAIPPLALGVAFLIVEIANFIQNTKLRYSFISILTILILIPNIIHIVNYRVKTVFNKSEVEVLDKLKTIADREDYVVSWWDYGYPIRYYSDVKTLSDGGKHSGSVNFPTSFALTHSQEEAVKLLKLDVLYTEKRFYINQYNKNIDKNNSSYIKFEKSNIAQMTLDYNFKDTNDFLTSLKTDIKIPKLKRDVYLYLPTRMLDIYPIVDLFSNIDLMTGKKGVPPFFYKTTKYRENKWFIDLGHNIKLEKRTGNLIVGNKKIPIKRFCKTIYDKSGILHTSINIVNPISNINVVFMSDYKQFLVVDDNVYNSTYFQLTILEHYDKNLFKPIILTPLAKVYKLK